MMMEYNEYVCGMIQLRVNPRNPEDLCLTINDCEWYDADAIELIDTLVKIKKEYKQDIKRFEE